MTRAVFENNKHLAVAVYDSGTRISLTDTIIRDTSKQDAGGTADLHQGLLSNHPVAINVQNEDFDIQRLLDHVVFLENQSNVDTSGAVPVPGPVSPFEGGGE